MFKSDAVDTCYRLHTTLSHLAEIFEHERDRSVNVTRAYGIVVEALERLRFQIPELHADEVHPYVVGKSALYVMRSKRRLPQVDVAKALGVSQAHYSRLERGQLTLSMPQLVTLANYYRCEIEDLI